MSDAIGLVSVLPSDGQGRPGGSETSEATQQLIDQEIRRMIETAHREVRDLLGVPNRPSPAVAQLATRSADGAHGRGEHRCDPARR